MHSGSGRIPIVAVLGGAKDQPTAINDRCSKVGQLLAQREVHLLTGGGPGVMTLVSQSFIEHRRPDSIGRTIGIIPAAVANEPSEPKSGYPNPYIEIPIFTHLASKDGTDFNSRNHINVLTPQAIIVLDGGKGTEAEVELIRRHNREESTISYATSKQRFSILRWAATIDELDEFLKQFVG